MYFKIMDDLVFTEIVSRKADSKVEIQNYSKKSNASICQKTKSIITIKSYAKKDLLI